MEYRRRMNGWICLTVPQLAYPFTFPSIYSFIKSFTQDHSPLWDDQRFHKLLSLIEKINGI